MWGLIALAILAAGIAACTSSPASSRTFTYAVAMSASDTDNPQVLSGLHLSSDDVSQIDTLVYESGHLVLDGVKPGFDLGFVRSAALHVAPVGGVDSWFVLYERLNHLPLRVGLDVIDLNDGGVIDLTPIVKSSSGGVLVEVVVYYSRPVPNWTGTLSMTLSGSVNL